MPDYISKYTGQEIDEAIGKSKSITKDATEINKALQYVDNTETSIKALNNNELITKRADGTLISTGIINEPDKIFFPKDGRFPSGSIDVGPGATISENGGWLQYHANTLGNNYLLLDYYVDSTGTTKPVYWERSQEEKDIIINPYNVDTLPNMITFEHIPTTDSQVNALYLDFVNPVSNFMVEIVSLLTNKPIKYIPNESAWKTNLGGLDFNTGINNVLQGATSTPFSLLKSYQLKFNFKSSNPINIRGNLTGNIPWLKVDRQLITSKNVLVEGDGTGSSDSPEQIRDKLQTLTALNRLDSSAIKNLPTGGSDTATEIRDKLKSLQGEDRLAMEDLKDIEDTISGDYIKTKLEELTDTQRLDASAIKNLPSGVDISSKADKNLTNVDNGVFNQKGNVAGLAQASDVIKHEHDLDRINSIIDQTVFTGTFKGDLSHVIDISKAYKGYFLTVYNVDASHNSIALPVQGDIQVGTIFMLSNHDVNSDVQVTTTQDALIDKISNSSNVPNGNVLFLVRTNEGWATGFSGVIPSSMSRLIADIKLAMPNIGQGGLTIQQIEDQLKDRLKTTAQIAQEFSTQLHTIDELINTVGLAYAYAEYGFVTDISQALLQFKPHAHLLVEQTSYIDAPPQGQYLCLRMPEYIALLIEEFWLDDVKRVDVQREVANWGNYDYTFYKFTTPIQSGTKLKIHFDFFDSIHQASDVGLVLQGDESTEIFTGITDLEMPSSLISVDPTESNKAVIKPYVSVIVPSVQIPGEEPTNPQEFKANSLTFIHPLQGFSNPNRPLGVEVEIAHDAYEKSHNPGFLAYTTQPEKLTVLTASDSVYRKGTIWFDDISLDADGIGITKDIVSKSYGIQEYDGKDPNVTGGTDFMVAFRASFLGQAPSDGFIRIMLIKKNATQSSTMDDTYIKDKGNTLMAVERFYNQGDLLGDLQLLGFVTARELQEFKCVVVTNIIGEEIYLNAKEDGLTGLMIQALTSAEKTGVALTQYELDTQQDLNFTAMYLGAERATLKYDLNQTVAPRTILQGSTFEDLDGWGYYAVAQNTVKMQDGYMEVYNDFNLHHIFSADETIALRGKQVKVTTELYNPQTGYIVALASHTGKPDEYATEIFKSRNLGGAVIVEPGWSIDFSTQQIINVGASDAFHIAEHVFTIPHDANNYAILIYPETDFGSAEIKLKQLSVDVVNPFNTYYLHSTKQLDELHLASSDRHKTFVQNSQSYYSLRYTLTNHEAPMPVGMPRLGNANIVLDPSVNKVQGSAAKGGEGALKFLLDGTALVKTALRLSNEKNLDYNTRFWYANVSTDGQTFTKIADSETTFLVKKDSVGTEVNMKPFRISVEKNSRIALRSQTDILDGAYMICTDDSKPMVVTTVDFEELTTENKSFIEKINSLDDEIVITQAALAAKCYIELDYKGGKPVLTAKQR
jgi:hypothetical protein